MEYFTAITTVALVKAAGLVNLPYKNYMKNELYRFSLEKKTISRIMCDKKNIKHIDPPR